MKTVHVVRYAVLLDEEAMAEHAQAGRSGRFDEVVDPTVTLLCRDDTIEVADPEPSRNTNSGSYGFTSSGGPPAGAWRVAGRLPQSEAQRIVALAEDHAGLAVTNAEHVAALALLDRRAAFGFRLVRLYERGWYRNAINREKQPRLGHGGPHPDDGGNWAPVFEVLEEQELDR